MENNTQARKKRFITILSIITILFLIYFIMFQSPIFKLKNIEVDGNKSLSYNDIISLTGIYKGMYIFKINAFEIKKRLLLNSFIKDADIEIKYPSSIIIKVEERKLVAQIPYNTNYIYIDDEGVAVKENEYDSKLPIINGIKIKKYEIGKKIDGIFDNNDMAKLLKIIYNKDIYKNITVIDKNNLMIKTKTGINIAFNNVNDVAYSIKFSELILNDLEKKGYDKGTIQISKNNNPVFLP
ncbi:MAG: FtsQ-type POTRA domain-containing protein [Thermoanaerobacteraceae bacterium]|nr:FtsQ-type POTRA domain-containing protein [Thermoanaerobacteraceae bacterium]